MFINSRQKNVLGIHYNRTVLDHSFNSWTFHNKRKAKNNDLIWYLYLWSNIAKNFLTSLDPSVPILAFSYTIIVIAILLNSVEIMLIVRKIKKATDFEIVLLNLALADLFNSIMFIVLMAVTNQYTKIPPNFKKAI